MGSSRVAGRIRVAGALIVLLWLASTLGFASCAKGRGGAGKIDPELERSRLAEASSLLEKGAYDEAIGKCSQIIACNPNCADAYFLRGNSYFRTDKRELAIQDYSETIELDPDNAKAYCNRGSVLAKNGELVAAIKDLQRALDLDPYLAEARQMLQRAKHELSLQQTGP